jgi:hypothetical protein
VNTFDIVTAVAGCLACFGSVFDADLVAGLSLWWQARTSGRPPKGVKS